MTTLPLLLAALAAVAVLGVAVWLVVRGRGSDVVHEVDTFNRAREMTTSWSQGGWNGPPRSPVEAHDEGEDQAR